ncbi:hypothetical protein BFP97_15755 [Roseivirga sp. 4D4]|uniref:amidohydrolase family protein n=1 Tax=Roseivirga sp. 4D4 TaxID=1889784 RepID=UPI0008539F56|nr:amidohydrolase family protein [Roseivirga sp. 4D4]OEK02889.1 hypothetical protein BFP97_15755 [Roseivirga sp. 4D4]
MKRLLTVLLLLSVFACGQAQDINGLIISNISIVDLEKGSVVPNQSVKISEGRITQIDDIGHQAEDDFPVIDGTGKYLIPGLMDCHVHTTAGPPNVLISQLEKALKDGVTMVRDMGGDAVMINEWQKDENLEIPTIYTSAIFAGKSWMNNDRRALMSAHRTTPGTTAWLRSIDSTEKIDQYLDEAKAFGLNGIKVYADLTAEKLNKITDKASERDMIVYAHATVYPATPIEVVTSGVVSVSHSERLLTVLDEKVAQTYHLDQNNNRNYIPEDLNSQPVINLIDAMKQNNVALDATLLVSKIRSEQIGDNQDSRLKTVYALTRKIYEAGIMVLAGTDYMIERESGATNLHDELILLVEKAGLSNLDALRAATINPAEVFKLDGYGQVAIGKIADLVLLNSNPLDKIANTKDVFLVIKNGKRLD